MAIVEDEVRNESEEENEIEVIVEEDDNDHDSDDSEDEEDEYALESKVVEIQQRISENPYIYEDHIELIQTLWSLSDLERWRVAFNRLHDLSLLLPEHWLLRLQTEVTVGHTDDSTERIADLFQQASFDCYSIPILSEWCSWAAGLADGRAEVDEVLRRAGADPANGLMFWDAKLEMERAVLEGMRPTDTEYRAQQERVLHVLEEAVSRPLMRSAGSWSAFSELATELKGPEYVQKVQKQHDAAKDYLEKIVPYEEKLRELENVQDIHNLYLEYIDKVNELSCKDKYAECDSDGIIKVLYDRATTAVPSPQSRPLLSAWVAHARGVSTRTTQTRLLHAATRRAPTSAIFWVLTMQQAEHEGKNFDEVKSIFETALSKCSDSFKEAERLWLGYLEYMRRRTDFGSEQDVDRLRRTFRLAWDSLAEAWGEEANDCEVPLYWARLEYRRLGDPRKGKEIIEEIFKYGDNKTLSKYWEALITLESHRTPALSDSKLRELHRRALRFVTDYPPAVARLWTEYERDYGDLASARECLQTCDAKQKEWRDKYHAMKDKMTGKHKGKHSASKKAKYEAKKKKKEDDEPKNKGKRKSEEGDTDGTEVKRKRDEDMEVDASEKEGASSSSGGVKRSYDEDVSEAHSSTSTDSKRQRTDSGSEVTPRDAQTLFVSNLEFKVDEQKLRDALSKYGDIVSLRVRAGVKAFGGSICYCQYKTQESVDEALKHDRTPLCGRPMFFSRYAAKKGKHSFKYSTGEEKNKLFVKNLPYSHCNKEQLEKIFDKYGKLKDIRVVTFKDGKPKGLAYIEYENESSASDALQHTHGLIVEKRKLDVALSAPPPRADAAQAAIVPALGQQKRDTGGMRRTQLSSFIPSVLQRPSTSKQASNGNHSDQTKPLSNTDFRNLLLKK